MERKKYPYVGLTEKYFREHFNHEDELNLQFFRENLWWWRRVDLPDFYPTDDTEIPLGLNWPTDIFFQLIDHKGSAFLYELEARIKGRYEFEFPWSEITDIARAILASRNGENWKDFIGLEHESKYFSLGKADDIGKIPWENWSPYKVLSFDLNISPEELTKKFSNMIELERVQLGIPKPKTKRGRPKSDYPWKPIEYMDIRDHNLRDKSLDTTESGLISNTLKMYYGSHKRAI